MANFVQKKISVQNLLERMVVAEDVVLTDGYVILPANTIITKRHINKLQLYNIEYVQIKTAKDNPNQNKSLVLNLELSFEDFKKDYFLRLEKIKEIFSHIHDKMVIDLNRIFSFIKKITDSYQDHDIFHYLYQMNHEEEHLYPHSLNLAIYCNLFGQWLNLNPTDLRDLTIAALFHDIGVLNISKEIVYKPDKLLEEEFSIIRNHSEYGRDILANLDLPSPVVDSVLHHHERFDGSGYPTGIKNDEIPIYAKIIAITDTYDAMVSYRVYRKKYNPFLALHNLETQGFGKLDTEFLLVFIQKILMFNIGNTIELSDGRAGKVVLGNQSVPSRPVIQIKNEILDLSAEKNLYIKEVL